MAQSKGSGVDMSSILDKKVEDIEMPKPVPVGTYQGRIMGVPTDSSFEMNDEEAPGGKRLVRQAQFNVALLAPTEGIDLELLEKSGGLNRKDGKAKEVTVRMSLEEDALHRWKKLGQSCGIAGTTLRDIFENLPNQDVLVDVTHRPDRNDPETIYMQGGRVAGLAGG